MRHRTAITLALSLATVLASTRAEAAVLALRVAPAGACPAREEVVDELLRLLPQLRIVGEGDAEAPAAIVEDLGDRYRVAVRGEKVVDDPRRDCGERARASALVIAVALEPPWMAAAAPRDATVADAPPARPRPAGLRPVQLLLGLGLGTAQAYVGGGATTEVAWQLRSDPTGQPQFQPAAVQDPGGFAFAWLHVRADIGIRIVDRWELITSLRAQLDLGADAETRGTESGAPPIGGTTKASGAFAGLLRARRRFPLGPIAPFVEVAVGGGEVRPLLDLSAAQTADKPLVDAATAHAFNAAPGAPLDRQLVCAPSGPCHDTIRLGPALVGAGAGMQIRLVERSAAALALSMSTTFLGAFGSGARALVVDWDVGLLVRAF